MLLGYGENNSTPRWLDSFTNIQIFNKASLICFIYLLKPSQQSQSAGAGSAGKKDKPVKNPADDVRAVDMLREAGKVSASLSLSAFAHG